MTTTLVTCPESVSPALSHGMRINTFSLHHQDLDLAPARHLGLMFVFRHVAFPDSLVIVTVATQREIQHSEQKKGILNKRSGGSERQGT
jgi:hypothetical protein